MYRPKEKLYNCIWTFHKYDEDFYAIRSTWAFGRL